MPAASDTITAWRGHQADHDHQQQQHHERMRSSSFHDLQRATFEDESITAGSVAPVTGVVTTGP